MADVEYLDDSELVCSQNMKGVNYDDIESGGSASVGRHVALIKRVKAQRKDYDTYTGIQAVLLFTIQEGDDKGKVAYDRIDLPHEAEEDWKKNKRLLVAKRCGLISREDKETVNINWKLLEGRVVMIELERNEYPDKKNPGKTKVGININQFKSYTDPANEGANESSEGAANTGSGKPATEKYKDI